MVLEIATPYGLAMTVVVVTWFLCAGSAAVIPNCTAELQCKKSPIYEEKGDFFVW